MGRCQISTRTAWASQPTTRPEGVQSALWIWVGDIRITSVMETNSLLIQSTQAEYNAVLAAIERIDIEPLQVLIESQVLDVELNEELQFGVNWFLTNNPDLIPPNIGAITIPFCRARPSAAAATSPAGSTF